jgi:predicted component of type VI protein secretion system
MIALRLVKCPDGSSPGIAPQPLDADGVMIGRSPQCGLMLADPLRGVSRKHAWIASQRGGDTALLRCISATTPLAVNGKKLEPGGEQVVKPGDRLRIGGFELQLEEAELTTIPLPVPHAQAPPAVPAPAPPSVAAIPARQSRLDALWGVDTAPDPLGSESPLPASIGTMSSLPAPSLAVAPRATRIDETWMRKLQTGTPGPSRVASPPAEMQGTLDITAKRSAHMSALLRAAAEGSVDPLQALRDACDELQAHQFAMVAAMRDAVSELIVQLGSQSPESSPQRTRLLEQFDDDFVRAYEEQARLAATRRNRA